MKRPGGGGARLVVLGLGCESLPVQSCRDFEPLKVGAYSDAEQSLNRRVEVIATELLMSEVRCPKGDTGPKTSPAHNTPASQPVPAEPAPHTTAQVDPAGAH